MHNRNLLTPVHCARVSGFVYPDSYREIHSELPTPVLNRNIETYNQQRNHSQIVVL